MDDKKVTMTFKDGGSLSFDKKEFHDNCLLKEIMAVKMTDVMFPGGGGEGRQQVLDKIEDMKKQYVGWHGEEALAEIEAQVEEAEKGMNEQLKAFAPMMEMMKANFEGENE